MLTRLSSLSLIAIVLLSGCTSTQRSVDAKQSSTTMPSQASLIGTWRMVSMFENDGTVHPAPAESPFFIRFYPDGTAATWPTPIAPVTRGEYKVIDGQLTLPDAPSSKPAQLRVSDTQMRYWTDDGGCEFERVTPDLEPGRLP